MFKRSITNVIDTDILFPLAISVVSLNLHILYIWETGIVITILYYDFKFQRKVVKAYRSGSFRVDEL
jgi:NADH:ubiquinone oxidoreductase subunit 3 (subunit A)